MSRKYLILSLGLAALLLMSGSGAWAAGGADLYKAKLCNTCHGADANTPLLPSYPKLAGQNAVYLAQQIKDIRDGKRNNGLSAAMKPMVANLSDADAQAISDWLATQ